MPPVARFASLYAAGLWAGFVAAPRLAIALGAGALGAALLIRRAVPWRAALLAAAAAGLAQGAEGGARRRAACAARWLPGRHAAVVRLADAPDPRGLATAVVRHAPEGCAGWLPLRLAPGAARSGATLVVVGQLARGGALRVEHLRVLDHPRSWRFALRDRVADRIARLYGPRAPLVDALVLARRGAVDPRLRADFAASGLAHLLAISGLHVGIIAGWLVLAARAAGVRRRGWVVAVAGTWSYVGLLGFPAPATRAAAFVAIHAVARLRQRHPARTGVLAVAVLTVLLVDPSAVTDVGAWLSVAAVWGTGAATALLGRKRRAVRRLLAASLGATLATAPITAYAFGAVAPVGVLANLAAVPLAGIAVPAVFGSLVLGALAPGAGLALALVERVAALGAALPAGHVTGDPGVRFALPWIGLLAAAAWWVWRRPTWLVAGRRLAGVAAIAAWIVALGGVRARDRGYAGLSIYVLAVGQGDAIALRSPAGRWVLVDAGPRIGGEDAGRRVVVPFLRRHGVRALDAIVLSHGDADHLGGVPAVLARVPVGMVLEPGQPLGTGLYLEYLGAVDRSGARWWAARAGDTLELDGVRLALLHPAPEWLRRETRANENSLVVRVSYGAFDALLTGDAGWPAESALAGRVGRIELLKVGHHGSRGSTRPAWVAELQPRVAVVSVGRNRYGHPAPEVLARLARAGVAVYRTDAGGTVTIRSDGRYFDVVQGSPNPVLERLLCLVRDWSPSRASSSSRNACTPRPRGSSPTSFTTWPSPPR